MKKNIKLLLNWLRVNWILVLILLVGAFLRLYKIDKFMTFLGDEGRDVIVVRNLLVNADPILIGPGTSVGSMYLGPLYYYFMAPFLLLFNFSPVGPAVGVALLGVLTIWLIYWVCKEWFSTKVKKVSVAGIVASFFYAISPTVINFSRSSWNPNIMPFFSLLTIYSIWKVWKEKKYKWLVVTGISYAFVLQSHYLGLLLAPVLFIFWIISKVPVKYTLIAGSIFLFLMSPLLIFDIRHGWMNTNAFYKFLTVRQETVSIKPWNALSKAYPIFTDINTSLLASKNIFLGKIITPIIVLLLTWLIVFKRKIEQFNKSLLMLLAWLGFALMGLSLYKLQIYDHYFGFLFPLPFILIGGFIHNVLENSSRIVKFLAVVALSLLFFVNIAKNPLRNHPNYQLQRSINVVNEIINRSNEKDFNFAVIAERNYEDGYQYFLEKEKSKFVEIDSQLPATVKDQLFVVCEMEEAKCDPTHSAKAEVANFGWSKIDETYKVDGVIIYKLVHSQ